MRVKATRYFLFEARDVRPGDLLDVDARTAKAMMRLGRVERIPDEEEDDPEEPVTGH